MIDADVSDAAYRLYSVLLRYGQSSGNRMPSRSLLARRLKKRSTDTVDRALRELVAIGAVVVERRRRGRENLTNRYHLMSTPPALRSVAPSGGGRTDAATWRRRGSGRTGAATPGRKVAATVAAAMRPDPGVPTQEKPPPPASPARWEPLRLVDRKRLCVVLGVEDLDEVAARCCQLRRGLGLATGQWTARAVAEVLHAAVITQDWPADAAVPALLAVAADPATRSPARLPCPGPWWDAAERAGTAAAGRGDADELLELESRLAETDGKRVWAQRRARQDLAAAGEPITRLSVARGACGYLWPEGGKQT
ncbi:MAG TPA: hypothetical protein VHN80_01070 [Kineosporiaceae bacterium]|nr:hypothetical protein [Kineosporiaceae bacterium]